MKISITIATYNRNESLEKTLKSFLRIPDFFNHDIEIIIADNNPTNISAEIINRLNPSFQNKLKNIHEPKKGKSLAINKAISIASGEIIAFTDDDVNIDPLWIKNMHEAFIQYSCDALGGRILPLLPEKTPNWVRKHLDMLSGPIGFHDLGEETKFYTAEMTPFAGANFAVKKQILTNSGGYNSNIGAGTGVAGEDSELFHRLMNLQKKILYASNVLVWHSVEKEKLTLKHLAKWAISSGQYEIYTNKTPIIAKRRFLGVPLYFYRQFLVEAFVLPFRIFNQRRFLIRWNYFFRLYGKIIANIKLRNRSALNN